MKPCTTVAPFSGGAEGIDRDLGQFRKGFQILLSVFVVEKLTRIAFAELAGCLGHVDIAILTEDDGEAVGFAWSYCVAKSCW